MRPQIGLEGVDLLTVEEWEVPRRYGLICTMGYAGGGTIPDALNRLEHHDAIEARFAPTFRWLQKRACPTSSRSPAIAAA